MEINQKKIIVTKELIEYLASLDLEFLIYKSFEILNFSFYLYLKDYLFFKRRKSLVPICRNSDLINIYVYDIKLKELFLPKLLFIESSLKSITSIILISYLKSDDIDILFEKGLDSNSKIKSTKSQKNIETLKNIFYQNPNNKNSILINLKEICFGQFGLFYKSLTKDLKKMICDTLNINIQNDSNKELFGDYIYLLKSLRNACAHNKIIYDSRFKESRDVNEKMKLNFLNEFKIYRLNFNDIIDYMILIVYFLKHLGINHKETIDFINKFEQLTNTFYSIISKEILCLIEIKLLNVKLFSLKNYAFFKIS